MYVHIQIHATCCCIPRCTTKTFGAPKERAPVGQSGCVGRLLTRGTTPSKAKRPRTTGSQQPACTHEGHCPPQRPLLLQPNFGIERYTPQRAHSRSFWPHEICSHSQAGRCMLQWGPSPCGEGQPWRRFEFGVISRPLCIAPSCALSNFQLCAQKGDRLPPLPTRHF